MENGLSCLDPTVSPFVERTGFGDRRRNLQFSQSHEATTDDRAAHEACHIRGAVFMALGAYIDKRSGLLLLFAQLVDTRRWEHFRGIAPDPRGLASGHILGSKNVPYHLLFRADGTYRELGSLESIFAAERVTLNAPIIATCGSGTSTARVLLAADLLGARDLALYKASWSEWGALADTPKRMGPGFHGEP
jgi:Rhodanese-like domain